MANRRVIIWPDNDEAGLKYAQIVAERLRVLNSIVQWVNVTALNLPSKGDCVDWLASHADATLQDIEALSLQEPQ